MGGSPSASRTSGAKFWPPYGPFPLGRQRGGSWGHQGQGPGCHYGTQ